MMKRVPVTPRGAALLGGSLALIVGGLLITDGLFVVLGGCGFVLMVLAWLLGKLSLQRLRVGIFFPNHVAARVPFELELTLYNDRAWLDAFQTEISLTLPAKTTFSAHAVWTAAGSASRITRATEIPGRGYVDTHRVTLSTSFPLGIFRQRKNLEIRAPLTITPRPIIPLELSNHGSMHDTLPRTGITAGTTFGEPRGIRPWQAGDSARHIHWPASARSIARGHGLRIREYDPPGFHPDRCHVIFHSYATGGEMLREDRFERALSLLTGAVVELQKRGIPCVLNADFSDWQTTPLGSRKQVVDFLNTLARVRRCAGTEAHDLEHLLRHVSPHDTLMIISDMPPDSWQHLLTQHPHTLIIDIRQIRYRHKTLQTAV